jgi:hypothetical protein
MKALTSDDIRNALARLQARQKELYDLDDPSQSTRNALSTSIKMTLARIFDEDTSDYRHFLPAANLERAPEDRPDLGWRDVRFRSIALLTAAIQTLQEDLTSALKAEERKALVLEGQALQSLTQPASKEPPTRKVFVVHGHDGGPREAVARFLQQIGFEPIILNEQASRGRTVIEKVEAHSDVRC